MSDEKFKVDSDGIPVGHVDDPQKEWIDLSETKAKDENANDKTD